MNNHVLIVDDDPVVRDLIREFLQQRGFAVSVLHHGAGLRRRIEQERPAIVVLDVMMPDMDGITALRELRASGDDIPVIFLSARSDAIDRIIGLELGADDYLPKPFDPQELTARIKTILRRRGAATPGLPESRPPYRFGPFEVDFAARELRRDGERLPLCESEFATLQVFVRHAMTVLKRSRLSELLHGQSDGVRDRNLDVSIWRLRRVIESDPSEPSYIQTVWGKGYIFVPDRELGAAEHLPH
ncbi:response regulator [Robbsia sp. KACC 23696]|uniref:response regulator n=1 Tax=Robbsia sp. KACC 23696 TaxID=3149231 RepID=UPI00325C26D8